MSGSHWVFPCSRSLCCPSLHCSGSRLLCRGIVQSSSWVMCTSRSKPLRFRFLGAPQRCRLGWVCVLCPPQVRAAQATRCLASALSQVGGASHYLPAPSPSVSCVRHGSTASGVSCVSSGGLISGCDPPGRWQPSRISEDLLSNWEPAHSLVEDAPCLLALAVAHLPLCFWQGDGPVCSQLALLCYSLNPLFCEPARLCLRLELFAGKFSLSLFFSLWLSHSLGCYLRIPPSDCPQGIQARSLP